MPNISRTIEIGEGYMLSLPVGKPISFALVTSINVNFFLLSCTRLFLLVEFFVTLYNLSLLLLLKVSFNWCA